MLIERILKPTWWPLMGQPELLPRAWLGEEGRKPVYWRLQQGAAGSASSPGSPGYGLTTESGTAVTNWARVKGLWINNHPKLIPKSNTYFIRKLPANEDTLSKTSRCSTQVLSSAPHAKTHTDTPLKWTLTWDQGRASKSFLHGPKHTSAISHYMFMWPTSCHTYKIKASILLTSSRN